MSDLNASRPSGANDALEGGGDELQFEQAEYVTPAAAGPVCGFCNRPIADAYYEVGGKVCCAECRQRVEAAMRGGSPVGRVIKALAFGAAAAVAGGVLYFAIVRLTGYNLGIVAIVVGFMVGTAVRKGTGNRGGRFYQFLAVFLAYSAIAVMNLSVAITWSLKTAPMKNIQAEGVPGQLNGPAGQPKVQPEPPALAANNPARPPADAAANPAASAPAQGPAQATKVPIAPIEGRNQLEEEVQAPAAGAPARPSLKDVLLLLVALVLLVYRLPVLVTIGAPLTGLIYGFALWEAWRLNKGIRVVFNGPFRVSAGGSITPAPGVVDDGG